MVLDAMAKRLSGLLRRQRRDDPAAEAKRYSAYPKQGRAAFINIGAGDFHHPRWTNIDHASAWYGNSQKHAFIQHNLMEMSDLPIEVGEVALAYSSHTIEHVTDAAVEKLFSEVYRVLRPGGLFRITCPDADLLYLAVLLKREDYWHWRHGWFRSRGADPKSLDLEEFLIRELATERSRFALPAEAQKLTAAEVREHMAGHEKDAFFKWLTGACIFRDTAAGNHINWWSFDKCAAMLRRAGFGTVYRSSRGASLAAPLQDTAYFDTTAPMMSLYLEAVR
jgi:SAM-dependent methyltransferase